MICRLCGGNMLFNPSTMKWNCENRHSTDSDASKTLFCPTNSPTDKEKWIQGNSKVFVGCKALHIKKDTICEIIIEDGAEVTIKTVREIE